jgi:hypothetical protein
MTEYNHQKNNKMCGGGARQVSSAPSPGGEGWDEGGQLFAPQRHNLIRQKKSVMHPCDGSLGRALRQPGAITGKGKSAAASLVIFLRAANFVWHKVGRPY